MIGLAREAGYLGARGVRALLRQPWYVAVTLVQPVIWLLLFSQLFRQVTRLPGFPGNSYIAFLTPGVVVMTCLFSSGWAGMGLIVDMDRGVMNRFLVSPVRRGALITGALLYQALSIVVQSLIILGLGAACGARFPGGAVVLVVFLVGVLLLGAAFASYSNALALLIRREESVIGAVNFLVLPLSFLSATLLPVNLLPDWMRQVARFNPVNWAVLVGRETLSPDVDWGLVASRTGCLAALAIAAGWLSTRAFRAYQRSV